MNAMQLKHLRTFLAVASTLNFTKAAQKVYLAQSSVTEQVQALEEDLGVALFDRSQRKLKLTDSGVRLVEYAEALLSLASDARAAVTGAAQGVSGKLALGALETLSARWLPPLLADFQSRHAGLQFDLRVAGTAELRNALKDGTLDVGFSFTEPPYDSGLHGECVGMDDLVLLLPSGHRFAGLAAIAPQQAAGERFMVTAQGCAYRGMFERAFSGSGIALPEVAGEYGSLAAIANLVRAGFGCALMPRLAVAGQEAGLAVLPWEGDDNRVPIHMAWRARQLPAAVRLFLDAVRHQAAALHQPVTSVDMQHAARGEAVSHEEADRVGDIVDVANPASR